MASSSKKEKKFHLPILNKTSKLFHLSKWMESETKFFSCENFMDLTNHNNLKRSKATTLINVTRNNYLD